MLLAQLIYLVFCTLLAYINYRVIKANLRVYHGINGLLHVFAWCYLWLIPYHNDAKAHWFVFLILPLMGRAYFDALLSHLRGFTFWYVSMYPKSKIDQLEKRLFRMDGKTPKIIYLSLAAALTITYYIIQ